MKTRYHETSLVPYFKELKKYPPLGGDEESGLLRRMKDDPEAKKLVIRAYTRFVVQVANEYKECGLPLPEIIAEGNTGLIRAADKFDPFLGYKFSTYAIWWIRRRIQMAFDQSKSVRRPVNVMDNSRKVNRYLDLFYQNHERYPTEEEIANALEITIQAARKALSSMKPERSIDSPWREEETFYPTEIQISLMNYEENPDVVQQHTKEVIGDQLHKAMECLTKRERIVLKAHYGFDDKDMTLAEIAKQFGVSRERVRQIKNRALEKLSEEFVSDPREIEGLSLEELISRI